MILVTLFALVAHAAEPQALPKYSDAELKDVAEKELRSTTPPGKGRPMEKPFVSTEITEEERESSLSTSEFEFGAQAYRPEGTGRISDSETYPLGRLNSGVMPLIGLRYWYWNGGLEEASPWRSGLSLDGGIASHTLKIHTQSGAVHEDVRLSTVITTLGPEFERFLSGRRDLALGFRAAVGRIFTVQSTNAPVLNRSLQEGIWSVSSHLRYQHSKSFFAKLAYSYRAILGTTGGLGTQESNVMGLIGFGM